MVNKIGWYHPVDEADQTDGYNDSGIAHFSTSPVTSLAREVHQNSLDAGDNSGEPVIVRIKMRDVPTSEIPNIDELKSNLTLCYTAAELESEKARAFFKGAIDQLSKNKTSVLEISDFNTRGMRGPSIKGNPFHAFMKGKGLTIKEDPDGNENSGASGSHGIGKNAPYAVSKIRTIFISTVYEAENQLVQLTQGKSILISHDDSDKEHRQGVGYWGLKEKCQPVSGELSNIPEWLLRSTSKNLSESDKGSKLSILCFDAVSNWKEYLAVSVAENFFGSIYDGKLRVEIEDDYVLDASSIGDFLENESIRALIEREEIKNEPEQFNNCRSYLAALQGGVEVFKETSEMNVLGLCEVKILLGEGLPKKVCIIRNGMYITDSLSGLKSFSDFKEFVAVFRCMSKKGNELLRKMEPPRHDDFEPDLLLTKEEQRRGKAALSDIARWVRESLKRHAKDPVDDVTELDELKDFFGEEGSGETGKGVEEINPYGEVIIRLKPISNKVKSNQVIDNEPGNDPGGESLGGEGGGGDEGKGGGDGLGGVGPGAGGTGGGMQKTLAEINNIRAVLVGSNSRRLSFTAMKSGKLSVYIKEAGADSDYDTKVVKTNLGQVKSGGVEIDVKAGERVTLTLDLDQNYSGALKVVAYEI
jgi:hypothetical protein